MSKEETLIKYRGQLKYIKNKYQKNIELIENYISRIENETSKVKDEMTYEKEKKFYVPDSRTTYRNIFTNQLDLTCYILEDFEK